jgi:hypothetical protein
MAIMMIMSMECDYISEQWPQTCLLFIPQVICEHGEPWWSNIDRGKLLICSPELWQSYQQSCLVANQEELDEGNDEFSL